MVGMRGAIRDTLNHRLNGKPTTYSITLGERTEQNPYTAELASIALAIRCLPPGIQGRQITIFTSNQAALLAVSQPQHQSGQVSIGQLYDAVHTLRKRGNCFLITWVPADGKFELGKRAKAAARQATNQGCLPREQPYRAKATTMNIARAKHQKKNALPEGVGRYSREMDTALPGKHTCTLYDAFK